MTPIWANLIIMHPKCSSYILDYLYQTHDAKCMYYVYEIMHVAYIKSIYIKTSMLKFLNEGLNFIELNL